MERAEVVWQALAWPVIREADPALSSHRGKQSKHEFTIASLSPPPTLFLLTATPAAIEPSARTCPPQPVQRAVLAAATRGILAPPLLFF